MTGTELPPKALLDRWTPAALEIDALTLLSQNTEMYSRFGYESIRDMHSSSWAGLCRRATEDRGGQQATWGQMVGRRIGEVKTELSDASMALTDRLASVGSNLYLAFAHGLALGSEDDPRWQMRYVKSDKDSLDKEQIAALEDEYTRLMRTTVAGVVDECRDRAGKISTALGQLTDVTPARLSLSGQDGRRDALAGRDGWSRDEARRIAENLRIAGLTDEQIKTLMNGGKLTDVPRGVNEYLHMFYNNTSGFRLAELRKVMSENGMADHTRYIGDGLLTLSNENAGPNTGYRYVPAWARDWVEKRVPDNSPRLDTAIATVMSGTRVPPGERFGVELQRKSADIAQMGDPTYPLPVAVMHYLGGRRGLDSTARHLLDVGTRNRLSSTAILTGKYADGTPLSDYDRDKSITTLYRSEWLDNGKTAGRTIDWIDEYANSGDPDKVALAKRAYKGLFDAVTSTDGDNNFDRLMNAGAMGKSIGELNPALADALRQASNPFLTYLADPSSQHIHQQGDLNLADSATGAGRDFEARAVRMFTLIAGDDAPNHLVDPKNIDPENPDGLNAATELWRDVLERANTNTGTVGDNPANASSLGTLQAQLLSRAQAGIYGAQFDQELDAGNTNAAANQTKQDLYKIMNAGSALVGLVPGGGIVGAPVAAIAPFITAPSDPDSPEFRLPASSVNATRPEQQLAALLPIFSNSGADVPPEWLDDNQKIKPVDELVRQEKVDASALTQRIRTALREYDSATYDSVLDNYFSAWNTANSDTDLRFNPTSRETYETRILKGR